MPFYTRATMADINVTFAGLPLVSPIIIEPEATILHTSVAAAAVDAGAGAICLPPLDEARMGARHDEDELTDNNLDDSGRRESIRIIHRLNIRTYLDEAQAMIAAVNVPVIAPLQCDRRSGWLPLAEQLREVGIAAVELRPPVEESSRTLHGEEIEKQLLRIVASVAGRIDVPVIVRIPPGSFGLTHLVQALGEGNAAAVTFRHPQALVGFDSGRIALVRPEEEPEVATAAFLTQITACRTVYRRVNPHLAVRLSQQRQTSIIEALLAGATLGFLPVEGTNSGAAQSAVSGMKGSLEGWMRRNRMASLFDARGLLSESRLTSSLEQ
jgi:dihydroorotate dehydrogenase (fumarate)